MSFPHRYLTLSLSLLLWFVGTSSAQTLSTSSSILKQPESSIVRVPEVKGESTGKTTPLTSPQGPLSEGKLSRWLQFQSADLVLLYQYSDTGMGVVTFDQFRYKMAFRGRVKFDSSGRFSLNAGIATGRSFTSGYNNTGAGMGHGGTNLALKQLYLSASPVEGLELQAGGLFINRGEATEITTYDNDGFITGYRASVRRPRQLFFNEISITYAYLGDIAKPNLNKRFNRLKRSNYHQFLVTKNFGKRAATSLDYTFFEGAETLRQAVRVNTRELGVLDSIRLEGYERLDKNRDFGFAIQGEKTLGHRLTLGGGFARIDRQYGGLNADRFGTGKRLFASGSFKFTPELSLNVFGARSVGNDYRVANRNRFDLFFSYNLLKVLQKTGLF